MQRKERKFNLFFFLWCHALISTFVREAAITVPRHGVGLDRPINISKSSELLTRLRALLTHFFQYWNKGPVFVNSLLQRACCHCNKLFFWGRVVCKRSWSSGDSLLTSMGSLAPSPSAVTWQLCFRSPAENYQEGGTGVLQPCTSPGTRLSPRALACWF